VILCDMHKIYYPFVMITAKIKKELAILSGLCYNKITAIIFEFQKQKVGESA